MPARFDNRFSPKYIEDLDQEAATFLKCYRFEDAIEHQFVYHMHFRL